MNNKTDHVVRRGGIYHFRAVIGGRIFTSSLHTADRRVAKTKAADLYRAAVSGMWADVEKIFRPAAVARKKATLGEVLPAYMEVVNKVHRPAPVTAKYAVQAILRVARTVHSVSSEGALDIPMDSVLLPKFQDAYADAMLLRDGDSYSTRVSVCSTLRTAKQVVKRDMIPRISRMVNGMPDPDEIDSWRSYHPIPEPETEEHEFTPAEAALLRLAGTGSEEAKPVEGAAWMAWALGFYAALRSGESESARWGWLSRYEPTDQERLYCPWLRDRAFIWVLRVQGTKTKASVADVPLHDTVAELLLSKRPAGAGDDDFMLGASHTHRENAIRYLSEWFRARGWDRSKTTHALRAYRIQAWFNARGIEARYRWGRHALRGMDAHYLAKRYLGAEPMPVDQ